MSKENRQHNGAGGQPRKVFRVGDEDRDVEREVDRADKKNQGAPDNFDHRR